ncbi:MAG: ABC-F family ATP-binding cassette domain-containing protein [Bacteroidales bacterium]|jgi:ATP-binding cassette subfamily F protein uup|nr:ABC-F family ATP-binding cassette domain-containing protein [Bacteroidales bacterium]
MAILYIENLIKYFGELRLFDNLSFSINAGEKVGLLAKNGTGKTTLISIILGKEPYESGTVFIDPNCTLGYLPQNPDFTSEQSIYNEVYYSFGEIITAKQNYNKALETHNEKLLEECTNAMDALQAWDYETRVNYILSKLEFYDTAQTIATLSGGQKKRVAMAKLLLREPDFIILDEPTNHLDLQIIEWLENYLSASKSTLLMVTHDRYFLERVCNTIVEIDDAKAFKYEGNYETFLIKKEERTQALQQEIAKARNLMRTELDWMRRQPQARGTKAKYRINAFYDLQDKASQQVKNDKINLNIQGARLGNKVIELKNISFAYGEKVLLNNFSYIFHRNEKIGIIGNNGCGKTTFLNIITEQLTANSGTIDYGETVQIGYYKQDGLLFNENQKVIDIIKEIAETIELTKGQVISAAQFLEQWLFPRSMHYLHVSRLSGGEKKRLYLMTILMKQPNFLILDEPTNNLDLYTLRILEDYLQNFNGCVVIVSHDRFFTDKVVQHLFVFKGAGEIQNFAGNYSQYRAIEEQKAENEKAAQTDNASTPLNNQKAEKPNASTNPASKKKKLSFKEQKELERLETEISNLEQEKQTLTEELHSGNLSNEELLAKSERIGVLINLLDEMEMQWLELDISREM